MAVPLIGIMIITACACGIIALISYHIKRLHLYRAAANFRGPPTLPIIGNAHLFFGNTADILNKISALVEKYPSPCRLWLGNQLIFLPHDADHVKTILLSNGAAEKSPLYKFGRPWLGTGLVTASAAKAKVHRKLIMPTFNQKVLDSFVEIFNKQSAILTKKMRKNLGKGEFDIFDYVSLCTLDTVCETAMGITVNAQTGNGMTYVDAVKRELEIIFIRMVKVWLHPDFIFNLTKLGKDQQTCLKYLHGVTDEVIHKKREALKKSAQMKNESAVPEQDTRNKAFLDVMMELSDDGQTLTDVELREEIDTMIVAANDTSATVMSFAMAMLANFPEIQEKVYEELCEIYGDRISSDEPIDKEDLNRMDYLERVLKETMRLFPPIQMLGRTLTEDIEIDEKTLPKGSSISISVFDLQRLEKYWPDPLKFDPDRFLPEEVSKRHPYCYIPFSIGSRSCVGQKYGFMVMKILMTTLLRRYVLIKEKPVKIQDMKLKAECVLAPAEPLTIKIVERSVNPKQQSTTNMTVHR